MTPRILVADSIAQEGIDQLRARAQVDVRPGLTPADLQAAIPAYDALVVRSDTKVTREIIQAATRLHVIGRAGTGVDNIDVAAATERGIVVVNAPAGNTTSAAELTVALLLALARHIPQADQSLRGGAWERQTFLGVELRGKVVGVVGLGQVGSAVARRLRALEMVVLGHDPFVPEDRARLLGVELVSWDDLLRRADFLTLHTPLTADTACLLDAEALARMKPGARIVNTARGGLVDEAALLAALDSGQIAAAALDVFAQEPATNSALVRHPRVICTPHLGASTHEAQERVAVDVAREVLNVLEGRPATTAVNAPFVDPESLAIVGPYLAVADLCGRLTTQLATGQWQTLRFQYQGEIADHDSAALKAALVRGLLAPISEERVNLVSVNNIIANRGWHLSEEKSHDSSPFANLVTVHLRTAAGEVCVSGTLVHGQPHIVEIDGFRVDVGREDGDHVLLLHNEDRPGRVGAVGTALGEMQVNISHMDVGKRDQRGEAIMLLSVDRALAPAEVSRLAAIPGIERVVQARL